MNVTKKIKWLTIVSIAMISLLTTLPVMADEQKPSDDKVAKVNGVVITRADFDREMMRTQQRLMGRGESMGDISPSQIQKEVLESLINQELLFQEGKKKGIKVEAKEVDEKMQQIMQQFPSKEEFLKALAKMQTSEETVRTQLNRQVTIRQFIDKEFVQKITVTDKDSKQYYDDNPNFFLKPEQVRASHILINVDAKADEAERAKARGKLEQIKKRIEAGEDFAALAGEFSDCPSKAKGGDLDYFRREQMVKPFSDVAFALKPGEVSDIVETSFGYHLIKVTDKQPESKMPYDDIKDRIQGFLKQQKVNQEVYAFVEKVKEHAKVERYLEITTK
jgi:peptidyl-prolyl cis-trans isomerase C